MTTEPAATPEQRLREIDCLVHRHVMGCEDVYYRPYSRTWDAAGQVLAKADSYNLHRWEACDCGDERHYPEHFECSITFGRKVGHAWGMTPQLAICLAALRALGVPTTVVSDGQ